MLNFIPMGSSEVGKGYLYSDKSRKMMFPMPGKTLRTSRAHKSGPQKQDRESMLNNLKACLIDPWIMKVLILISVRNQTQCKGSYKFKPSAW